MSYSIEEAYQILEVSPSSSWEEVRQAYREMVKVWHPDRFQDDEKFKARATRKVQDINLAYQVLETHYQKPSQPPPIPQPNTTDSSPQSEAKEEHQFWSRSADGLAFKIAGGQPYQIFPCRIHGFDRYRQHLEVIPLYLWMAGCICVFSALMVPALAVPGILLIPASFLVFVWGKYERWKDPVKIRPDAILVHNAGLTVVQWVLEHTGTNLHMAKTVFTIPWANLTRVEQKSSELILHVQVESLSRTFTVKPMLFEWMLGRKHTGYYTHAIISKKEFTEATKSMTTSV